MTRSPLRVSLVAALSAACLVLALQPIAAKASSATLTLSKMSGPPTTRTVAIGAAFGANEVVDITFDARALSSALADQGGSFFQEVGIPRNAVPGPHDVTATGESSGLS